MAENLPKNLEIVATVTHSRHCANFISENETFVFDVNGCLLQEKSSANLCLWYSCANSACFAKYSR